MEVVFIVNGVTLVFNLDAELANTILTDDQYAIDYLRRATISGNLAEFGILPSDADSLEITRGNINEYVNLSEPVQQSDPGSKNETHNSPDHFSGSDSHGLLNPSSNKFSKELTTRLLECRGCSKYVKLFNDKKSNKGQLWNRIAQELITEGFDLGINKPGEKCRQKFANLQKGYINFMNNMKQTGSGAVEKPWYFDLIDGIVGDKHKVCPPLVIDTENISGLNDLISNNSENILAPDLIPGPSGVKISSPSVCANKNILPETPTPNDETPKKNRFEQSKLHIKPATKTAVHVLQEIHSSTQTALQENKNMIEAYLDKQVEFQDKDNKFKESLLKMLGDFLTPKKKRKRQDSTSSDD